MNVLYDISILGYGYEDPVKKTGIFRVIETLTPLLAAFPECRLTLCASHHGPLLRTAMKAHPGLRQTPFIYPDLRLRIHEEYTRADVAVLWPGERPLLPLRLRRKAYHLLRQVVGQETEAIDARALRGMDIFHSTFDGLPEAVRRNDSIRKFLTVYDLIPIRFPEYFRWGATDEFPEIFRRSLETLLPDGHALCISESTKSDLCELVGVAPERVFVTPLAADPVVFYPCEDAEAQAAVRRKYGLPPDAPYLLSLSTLEPRKNIDHVIRGFARLVREQPGLGDLHLALAGAKGWDYGRIFAELEQGAGQGVAERVVVTGRVEDADMAALYSGAVAFVYLSLYEGFGLPPLEAMQCGVPVITSNTSSLPEVVGDAGLMLDPHDEEGLCQAFLRVLQDSNLRQDMARKALARAREFNWERCARETVQAYRASL
jgi:glycosyltransferase involved in cell wall biosynthesis